MGALGILRIRKRLERKIGRIAPRETLYGVVISWHQKSPAAFSPLQNRDKSGTPDNGGPFLPPHPELPSPFPSPCCILPLREVLSRPRHPVDAKSMPVPGRVRAKNPSPGHVITRYRPSETAVGKNITGDIVGVCGRQWFANSKDTRTIVNS